jgi:hypothetical protein
MHDTRVQIAVRGVSCRHAYLHTITASFVVHLLHDLAACARSLRRAKLLLQPRTSLQTTWTVAMEARTWPTWNGVAEVFAVCIPNSMCSELRMHCINNLDGAACCQGCTSRALSATPAQQGVQQYTY